MRQAKKVLIPQNFGDICLHFSLPSDKGNTVVLFIIGKKNTNCNFSDVRLLVMIKLQSRLNRAGQYRDRGTICSLVKVISLTCVDTQRCGFAMSQSFRSALSFDITVIFASIIELCTRNF